MRDNQLTQAALDGKLIYDCPIQLIYRDGLSKSTYSSLTGLIKINKLLSQVLPSTAERSEYKKFPERKKRVSKLVLPRVRLRIIGSYIPWVSVTKFALTRYGLFSKFFRPLLFRSPFSLFGVYPNPPLVQPLIFIWILVPSGLWWRW